MDESIAKLCEIVASFCNHLQSSCDALKQSVDRRPIPLDSASTTFVQCLNRRVSSTSSDLNLLESMSFGTVSFEELLGHCNEVYKKNESDLLELGDRLRSFGYIPEYDTDDEGEEEVSDDSSYQIGLDLKKVEANDPLFEDSMSLEKLGLSDVCLATIASENIKGTCNFDIGEVYEPSAKTLKVIEGENGDDLKCLEDSNSSICLAKDDYEGLPSYMKSLSSWEDLSAAVEKINSSLSRKEKAKGNYFFHQDELASLELGPKARSYLLMLIRMNRLVVETIDGLISYRVL